MSRSPAFPQDLKLPPRVAALAAAVLAPAAIVYAPSLLGVAHAWPDWGLLARQEAVLQLHLGAAVLAFLIGTLLMAGPKGRSVHKRLGWAWVVAMAVVAVSSFWLRELNPGRFSWIHALSGWTLVVLPAAVYAVRTKRVRLHRRAMTALFYGGLIVAGLFAFTPGRVLWDLAMGHG